MPGPFLCFRGNAGPTLSVEYHWVACKRKMGESAGPRFGRKDSGAKACTKTAWRALTVILFSPRAFQEEGAEIVQARPIRTSTPSSSLFSSLSSSTKLHTFRLSPITLVIHALPVHSFNNILNPPTNFLIPTNLKTKPKNLN